MWLEVGQLYECTKCLGTMLRCVGVSESLVLEVHRVCAGTRLYPPGSCAVQNAVRLHGLCDI